MSGPAKSPEHKTDMASVSWEDVLRRLEASRAATEHGFTPSPEEKRRILRDRARALAKGAVEEGPASGKTLDVVEFLLAGEHYAIESEYVRAIRPLKDLTLLPCTPGFVSGITNVQGQILSVIDLKKLFDIPDAGLTSLNKIVIARMGTMELGILADDVLGVRSVPVESLQPSLSTTKGIQAEYLRGVTSDRLIVLDIGRILSDRRLIVQEKVEP